jgi:hypothetical protein
LRFSLSTSAGPNPVCGGATSDPFLRRGKVFVVRRRQNARTMPVNVVADHLMSVFKEDRALFEDD